ncbi:hypothetical protein GCM10023191_013070 [Actinoallomurus oryzae]|jgi:hypothetical protein|uniref:Uncharacterized protein n=1 Tax=Actinoallomurus oryzae TaxID=502180 RepID=A0ABP8PGZ2_9ACTN
MTEDRARPTVFADARLIDGTGAAPVELREGRSAKRTLTQAVR